MWKEAGIFGIFLVSMYVLFRDHSAKQRRIEEENKAIEELQNQEYLDDEDSDLDEEMDDHMLDQEIARHNDNRWVEWENQMLQEQQQQGMLGDEEFDQRFDQMTPEELQALRDRINPQPNTPRAQSSRNKNREVGAKKAKSLERRDRVRAYHEYVRQVAMAEKRAHEEYEEAHRDLIDEEKRRRLEKEAALDQLRKQRQLEKREKEQHIQETKAKRRAELESELESAAKVRISEADLELVQGMSNALVVGGPEDQWLVRADDPHYVYTVSRAMQTKGRVSLADLASEL